ncbi:MAG: four helix bundle protein [Gemmatimonadaceae bacterium]|jgi:four helix bundle protein|nr:four helix bundle protein [Gemmatimonadaceae bacterium]
MQPHQRLLAWQRSHALALTVHATTRRIRDKTYPGLASQLRRAAGSIPANIAEGAALRSDPQFARHLNSAFASAQELEAHLELARDIGALGRADALALLRDAIEVKRVVMGLLRRIESDAQRIAQPHTVPRALEGLPLLTDATGLSLPGCSRNPPPACESS